MVSLIVYAIPFFFLMIGVEYVLSLIVRRQLYRWNDTVNDLSMGIVDQVVGVTFSWLSLVVSYTVVYHYFHVFNMGASSAFDLTVPWWVWVVAFFAKDFGYYWAHRMSHEINLGWATHIAHHQSEEYNLSVALRQGVFQPFFFNFFYIPFAIIGIPPGVFAVCSQINTIYQFWIHTRAIGKLGPLELIMNTPSHHRVHHGRDPKYIDRNHAGVFIIWDRIFGTFQEEEEEPHFGLVTPLASFNPIWGQIHYLVRLVKLAWAAPNWGDKLRVWYKPPAWAPAGLEPKVRSQELWDRGELQKYNPRAPIGLRWYVAYHFVPILLLVSAMLGMLGAEDKAAYTIPWLQSISDTMGGPVIAFRLSYVISAGLLLWALFCLGGALERKRWMLVAEPLRIVAMAAFLAAFGGSPFGLPQLSGSMASALVLAYGTVSFFWVIAYRREFTTPMGRLFGAAVDDHDHNHYHDEAPMGVGEAAGS